MKRFLLKITNAYWLKEYILLLRYYKKSLSTLKRPMLISAIDNRRNTQGLTDRFKGIVSIYALSKALNIEFKCVFTHPFHLSEFLIPNKYDWLPANDDLSASIKDVRFRIMRKERTLKRLLNILPSNKQVRVYANVDYLEELNHSFNQNFKWGELFNELFIPTEMLEKQLNYHLNIIRESEYIACVFRFQSLLGDFKEYKSKSLSENERELLIEKNRKALVKLIENSQCKVLITSDSMLFISEIKDLKNVYTLPGKVVHMDCVSNEQNEVYMKSFIDFFMLSKAKKIYSIGTKQMYPTSFPFYAAKINDIPFERILID